MFLLTLLLFMLTCLSFFSESGSVATPELVGSPEGADSTLATPEWVSSFEGADSTLATPEWVCSLEGADSTPATPEWVSSPDKDIWLYCQAQIIWPSCQAQISPDDADSILATPEWVSSLEGADSILAPQELVSSPDKDIWQFCQAQIFTWFHCQAKNGCKNNSRTLFDVVMSIMQFYVNMMLTLFDYGFCHYNTPTDIPTKCLLIKLKLNQNMLRRHDFKALFQSFRGNSATANRVALLIMSVFIYYEACKVVKYPYVMTRKIDCVKKGSHSHHVTLWI